MSESLIVEVRRLREAQEHIKARLEALVELASGLPPPDDIQALLDQLETEIERLKDSSQE